MDDFHFVVLRKEYGGNSGSGNGWSGMDTIQVMAASRTESDAKRQQQQLGGWIERVAGPFRRYAQNELLRECRR